MTDPVRILIAEDDSAIREGLADTLASEGYDVLQAENGQVALTKLKESPQPDLLILDIMMPELSGYDVCRELRKTNPKLPVMMLTAKGEEIDKVLGLELGADDYLTKPFGVRELLARVHALLRRSKTPSSGSEPPATFDFGDYTINTRTFTATNANGELELSARELTLLQHFSEHIGEVLSRDELLNVGWGIEYYGTTRTLDQHIAQLRKKIEPDPKTPKWITTVHGVGYRYQVENEA